ncbi:6032_t:CDS:2, partial [Gigaspora margarita]
DRIRPTTLKDKQDKEIKEQDTGLDTFMNTEHMDSNIETQIDIDENLVSGKSSKTLTIPNNMTLLTEHNTTKGHDITEKIETESNTTIEDDAPEKRKQKSYSKAVTGRHKRDNEETNYNNTNDNRRIPDNIDTIKAMIKKSQPEKEVELPITKYENIEQTIEILKTKFKFSNIPQHLVQLPELDIPEWNLYEYDNEQ